MAVDVDNIQLKLNSKFRFQVIVFICLGIIYARGSWNTFGVLFLAADVAQSCDDDDDTTPPSYTVHPKHNEVGSNISSVPRLSDKKVSILSGKECSIPTTTTENVTNVTNPCPHGWIYHSEYKTTIVSKWKIVCVRAYLAELSTTLYMVGSMFGAVLITPFSDKFGRRPVLLFCLFIQAAVGLGVAWAPNYELFTFLRFVVGFFNMGIALCTYVMMIEVFPARYRPIPCLGFQIFWAIGVMMTALFGYVIQKWRYLQLAISLPNIVCAVFVWILPESLPWLISQNKLAKAQKVIETIARFNSTNPPNDLFVYETTPIQHNEDEDKHKVLEGTSADGYVTDQPLLSGSDDPAEEMHLLSSRSCNENPGAAEDGEVSGPCTSFQNVNCNLHQRCSGAERSSNTIEPMQRKKLKNVFSLCYTFRIRLYSAIMFYLFFVNSLSYFGISLSIPILHGDPYLNLFLLGAVEIPAYIICIVVCARVGRKIPLLMFMLICGFMNIVAMLISEKASMGMSAARLVFVMAGKLAITAAYSTVYLYASEIFPTAIRNHALGVSSFFENLGSIAAPFVIYFAKSHQELPMVLFGVLSVIGGVTVFALPETQRQPLPQTVAEVESWGMLKRRRIEVMNG